MSVVLRSVGKSFAGVPAVHSVDLELLPGEAHALLGENGAGKSTIIKILAGVHSPTSGELLLDGRPTTFDVPDDALHAGISVVHQERHLVPEASIAENVFLGRLPTRFGFVDGRRLHREASSWLREVGLDLDSRTTAGQLSSGQGQLVEIARALSRRSRVLLLDEPTASIGEEEVARLFTLLQRLKTEGTTILFVSHKLDEVYALCDRITVIRDGADVMSGRPLGEVSRGALVEAMVGREYSETNFQTRPPAGEPVLELRGVSTAHGHRDIDLELRAGEIVGVYGLVGAGRSELARAIVGLDRTIGGEIRVHGLPARIRNPREALREQRVCYVSEDRKAEGLVLGESIERNASMPVWSDLASRSGLLSRGALWPAARPALERLAVKMRDPQQLVGTLSGGNQQKISVGKWLVTEADVFLFDEPTVGIDIAAKAEVHQLLWDLAGEGKAVLMISSDLREVVTLADRVLVMAHDQWVAELDNSGDYDSVSREVMHAIVAGTPQNSSAEPAPAGP